MLDHLDPTDLLQDAGGSCSVEPYTTSSEDANLNPSEAFAAATTWPCMGIPKARWNYSASPPLLTSELDVYVGPDCPVAREARLTYNGELYRVMDVSDFGGGGKVAYCRRWEQVTG